MSRRSPSLFADSVNLLISIAEQLLYWRQYNVSYEDSLKASNSMWVGQRILWNLDSLSQLEMRIVALGKLRYWETMLMVLSWFPYNTGWLLRWIDLEYPCFRSLPSRLSAFLVAVLSGSHPQTRGVLGFWVTLRLTLSWIGQSASVSDCLHVALERCFAS